MGQNRGEMSILSAGVSEVINRESLDRKIKLGKKLRVKLGVDPSSPNLHLGHFVVLSQLREFMNAGHKVIFLVGDFTATIGDPSGRNKERSVLSDKQVMANLKTYVDQVSLVLDPKKIEIRFNSEWFGKMTFGEWLKLSEYFTANQVYERDDFAKRLKEHRSLGIHEIMYPMMQAYDSVMLKADVEMGGTDQRFNMLAGRALQKKMGLPCQEVVMMHLLVGTDGKKKMSKSVGNTIDLNDTPEDIYGKTMSVPDEAVKQYAKLILNKTLKDLSQLAGSDHPKAIKEQLAYGIVELFSPSSGNQAREHFNRVYGDKKEPVKMLKIQINHGENIKDCLLRFGIVASANVLRRLAEQNAVKINREVANWSELAKHPSESIVVKIGKSKFVEIIKI